MRVPVQFADVGIASQLVGLMAVERTLASLVGHRRLVRDYGRDPATSEALIR